MEKWLETIAVLRVFLASLRHIFGLMHSESLTFEDHADGMQRQERGRIRALLFATYHDSTTLWDIVSIVRVSAGFVLCFDWKLYNRLKHYT
jgi:hypothetical protein